MNILSIDDASCHVSIYSSSEKIVAYNTVLQMQKVEWDLRDLKDETMLPLGVSP